MTASMLIGSAGLGMAFLGGWLTFGWLFGSAADGFSSIDDSIFALKYGVPSLIVGAGLYAFGVYLHGL